eukprot:755178-Hanusia_phi.AAC.2
MHSALSDSASFPERRGGREGLPAYLDQDALWGRSSSGSGSPDKFSDSDSSMDRQLGRLKANASSNLTVACHNMPKNARSPVRKLRPRRIFPDPSTSGPASSLALRLSLHHGCCLFPCVRPLTNGAGSSLPELEATTRDERVKITRASAWADFELVPSKCILLLTACWRHMLSMEQDFLVYK